jgi:hypothetical protein
MNSVTQGQDARTTSNPGIEKKAHVFACRGFPDAGLQSQEQG